MQINITLTLIIFMHIILESFSFHIFQLIIRHSSVKCAKNCLTGTWADISSLLFRPKG